MEASSSNAPIAYLSFPSDGANESAKSKSGPGPLFATESAPAGSIDGGASGSIFWGDDGEKA